MKLQGAIEDLETQATIHQLFERVREVQALKLGIEALEARKRAKAAGYIALDDLLPGEEPE